MSRRLGRKTKAWSLGCLLLVQALLLGWMDWRMCPNRTEVGHMAASVYLYDTLRFDVFHVNPPLTRAIVGLPVVLCQPNYNWELYSASPQDRCEWALGSAFLAANNSETMRWCFALARWSLIPLLLLGGYCGWRLSSEIYGDTAGMVFLVVWCCSPVLLAWGATICPDASAAALGIVALYTLRRWLCRPRWGRAILAGFCLGLLPLSKLTWLLAFALWPLLWLLWNSPCWLKRGGPVLGPTASWQQMGAVLFIGLYVLNMGYLFDGTGRALGEYSFRSRALRGSQDQQAAASTPSGNRFAGSWLGYLPLPLPGEFVQGIDTQRVDFERGMPSYAGGQWSDHGWWWYYLYVLVVKMPLATWGLCLLALLVTVTLRGYNAAGRDELFLLFPLVVLFVFVSSQTGISAHSRYILPVLPFGLVWISKVGRSFARGHQLVAGLVTVALSGTVVSSLAVYPHSLSYFNELVGGPRHGAKYLLDSNLDWGQDLFYLEQWCITHPEARPMEVIYSGMYPLERTQIPTPQRMAEESGQGDSMEEMTADHSSPKPGWYAVSLNELYGRSERCRDFLKFQPVAMAGYSISIYHITSDRTKRGPQTSCGPSLPEGAEADPAEAEPYPTNARN